jgi:4-hydroxy-2-oxoheptanedioate aldolase
MQKNKLKALLSSGKPILNGWCSIGNSFTAEIMASQGFDSVTVDIQHGALDYSDVLTMFQAMQSSGATLMARVPWRDPAYIMKALDVGAMGIICPMINNAEEAVEFISYMRYPPSGQRSFGPTRVAVQVPDYGVEANNEVLAFAMIETADGIENLEAIAATVGLDGIYVGPADLTLGTQLGRLSPGLDRTEEEMVALIKKVANVCNKYGIISGIHCGTAEYASKAIGWGYNLTTVGGDTRFLTSAASASVSAWQKLTGREKDIQVNGGVY